MAVGGSIGTVADDIELDTDGRLVAEGEDGAYVSEITSSLKVLKAVSANGDDRLTAFDTSEPGEDLELVDLAGPLGEGGLDAVFAGQPAADDGDDLALGVDGLGLVDLEPGLAAVLLAEEVHGEVDALLLSAW